MSKPSLAAKIKKIAEKKAKMEALKNEIDILEEDMREVKNKEFNKLSMQFFKSENDEKRAEIEQKIKALIMEV